MKNSKRAASTATAIVMCCGLMSAVVSAESTETSERSSSRISLCTRVTDGDNRSNDLSKYMTRWTSPQKSYLYAGDDGTLNKITVGSDGAFSVDVFSDEYEYISSITPDKELPVWGGFYSGSEYNFCIFGQTNKEEDDSREVLRIVKYSKAWERLDSVSLYGCNTTVPFDAGTPRMYEDGGNLYVHTSHEMYAVDGINHQANFQIHVDIDSMECFYSYYDIMNIRQAGYVSHSFDQYVRADGEYVYTLDLGDANPRCAALSKKDISGKMIGYGSMLDISGTKGNNTTGVSLGGFELSENNCIAVGNSMAQDGTAADTAVRNIFVSIVDKQLDGADICWLTDFEDAYRVSVPKLVKLDDTEFVAMWNEYENASDDTSMHAVKFTEDGTILEDITCGAVVSACDPIVVGNEIIWFYADGDGTDFYHIDYTDLSQYDGVYNSNDMICGDVDLSGEVEIADAVKIMCYITDPDNNPIEPQGLINGDVYQVGDGLSVQDALSIQKYLAQIIKTLPES